MANLAGPLSKRSHGKVSRKKIFQARQVFFIDQSAGRFNQQMLNLVGLHLFEFGGRDADLEGTHRPAGQFTDIPCVRVFVVFKVFPERDRDGVFNAFFGLLAHSSSM